MTATLTPVSFPALGTTCTLLVTDTATAARAREILEAEIDDFDRACSRFRTDSELAEVNASAGRSVVVSALFLDAVELALRAASLTDGRVDPTVGTAMRVLGYDRDFSRIHPAGPSVHVTVKPVPGWRLVWTDRGASTVRVPPGVELDLGATAKALCADRSARKVADATGRGVLISLGGDIAVGGPAPAGGWRVRVTDDHTAPTDAPGQTVVITSGGLATSGVSVRRWTRGGRQLHHLVDPARGLPAETCWRTVSVAAGSCADANIASTAAMIAGQDAVEWLEARHLPARLVDADDGVVCVGGWPAEEESPC